MELVFQKIFRPSVNRTGGVLPSLGNCMKVGTHFCKEVVNACSICVKVELSGISRVEYWKISRVSARNAGAVFRSNMCVGPLIPRLFGANSEAKDYTFS